MPTGQALVSLLQSTNAIKMTGGIRPTFAVNFAALRAAFQPEQAAMATAIQQFVITTLASSTTVTITPNQTQRVDAGTIALTPPGGQPVTINVIILLGTDGAGADYSIPGVPRKGFSVTLDERGKSGYILIAAGGNGANASDGGSATVIGGDENLLVAPGGNGTFGAVASRGTDAGDGTAQGIGVGNDLFAQGGAGGTGGPGKGGSAAIQSDLPGIAAVPAGGGAIGMRGGDGGKAVVSGGSNSYALAEGGGGGTGGPGGPGGAGAAAVVVAGFTVAAAVAPGPAGRPGSGGDGGNYKVTVGANSLIDPASAGGPGGPPAGVPGRIGATGMKE